MKVHYLTPASVELADAISYYEGQQQGLGQLFLSEVEAAVEKVTAFPNAWAPVSDRTRRILFKRFPFGLLYQVRDEEIIVAAVMDLRKDPSTWENHP